ncbi:hypothetical protein GGR21_000167 [Dysgonomonas hofstadii]|uniref:BACON domain-containing protein n=1 Tax=Dysgonomonas hofstadii TaxID=637886 RepID=A0A840CNY3_9BACT|nr:BACON domain-containing protein [Dysgonomonas hofstadii]MBB4034282.1 hypothetical protein [Dysgonomonas hofstadii]
MEKIIKLLLLGFCLLTTAYACSNDDDAPEPELIVSAESILFKKEGGDKVMHIKTNHQWTVSSSETWCTVTPSSGDGTGTIKLTVNATENTSNDERSAVLTVNAGGITKQVVVTQALTNKLVITKKEYEAKVEGETITVNYQATGDVAVKINGDWIT